MSDNGNPICDYENSSYRTDFWEGQGREYEDLAERIALRKLLPRTGRRIIDIGAGFGRLADLYDAFDHVILLDYSHSQLVYARQRFGSERFTYVAADLYRLPLANNAVDTLVMVRVMHHLANVPEALQQLHRVLQPGGTAVIEFANKRHVKNILRRIAGREPDPFSLEPYEFAPLHFNFHPRWMRQRLADAGFTVRRTLSVSLLRSAVLKRRLGASLLAKLDGIQQRLLAPLAISPSIFTRSAASGRGEIPLVPLDKLFICPNCQFSGLQSSDAGLHCRQCGHDWPIIDGVYVFK
ncbi:MAG: class I SAM-dependent methyltransferase [Anaerolineae bacterium]